MVSAMNRSPVDIRTADLAVLADCRGQGIARQLLAAVYRSFGFAGYELNPETGRALFWQKKL